MKKVALILLCSALLLVGCSMDVDTPTDTKAPPTETTSKAEPTTEAVVNTTAPTEPEPEVLKFLDELEYSAEQIEDMRTVLTNVGITEITELEIGVVSYGMQTVKGIAFTTGELRAPKEVQVRFNIENGVIYLVSIYCPSYGTSNQPTYLSGLSDRRADLYYDTEGGYLKKIDWANKAVVDYK